MQNITQGFDQSSMESAFKSFDEFYNEQEQLNILGCDTIRKQLENSSINRKQLEKVYEEHKQKFQQDTIFSYSQIMNDLNMSYEDFQEISNKFLLFDLSVLDNDISESDFMSKLQHIADSIPQKYLQMNPIIKKKDNKLQLKGNKIIVPDNNKGGVSLQFNDNAFGLGNCSSGQIVIRNAKLKFINNNTYGCSDAEKIQIGQKKVCDIYDYKSADDLSVFRKRRELELIIQLWSQGTQENETEILTSDICIKQMKILTLLQMIAIRNIQQHIYVEDQQPDIVQIGFIKEKLQNDLLITQFHAYAPLVPFFPDKENIPGNNITVFQSETDNAYDIVPINIKDMTVQEVQSLIIRSNIDLVVSLSGCSITSIKQSQTKSNVKTLVRTQTFRPKLVVHSILVHKTKTKYQQIGLKLHGLTHINAQLQNTNLTSDKQDKVDKSDEYSEENQ